VHKKKKTVGIMDPENWSEKQIRDFNYIYPDGVDSLSGATKKSLITAMIEREFPELNNGGESKNQSGEEVRSRIEEMVETIDTLLEEQKTINSNISYLKKVMDEWREKQRIVNEKLKKREREIELINQLKKSKARAAEEKAKQKKILSQLNALGKNTIRIDDDSSSDEEIEEIEEIKEIEETKDEFDFRNFPGEDIVEEFEHDSLEKYEGIDFYIDDNYNVWDEDTQFVGFFSRVKDSISFKKDYEPEDYSFSVE
jgi:DNA repair exonuclease SbcCD ATPase subunit